MEDFLSSRPQIGLPRRGQSEAFAPPEAAAAAAVLPELQAEVRTAAGTLEAGAAPRIETVIADGRIRRLHIHCKCGEEIIVHCQYPA